MDKVNGKKTKLATWAMVERVVRDLVERPDMDDPVRINLILVYVVQAWLRSSPVLERLLGLGPMLNWLFELLRKLSRKVLQFIFDRILDEFLGIVKLVLEEKKILKGREFLA